MITLTATPENEALDRSRELQEALDKEGSVQLGEGIFRVQGVKIPKNGFLKGCGANTVLLLPEEVEEGYILKIQEYCTVESLALKGQLTPLAAMDMTEPGKRDGILLISNYNGKEEEELKATKTCFLSNLFITDFTGSGVRGHNTGYSLDSGMFFTNGFIDNCGIGINLDYWTEFNKFTNVNCHACFIACVNNGGNNVYVNCIFHGMTGMLMDNRKGDKQNNSHGSVVGCTFDHCGRNKGDAIRIYNQTARFIFTNCQFWYDCIRIYDSPGILLSGCLIGREVKLEARGTSTVLVGGNIFAKPATAPFRWYADETAKVLFRDNMNGDTGEVFAPEMDREEDVAPVV